MHARIIPLMWVFVGLAHFNRVSISVAGAEIIRSGLIEKEAMGLVYSAFLLVYTAFMIPGGWVIDWLGPRAAWMIVGFGTAGGLFLTGIAGMVFTSATVVLASLP
jgi:ACS family D-galactonate transporter-like MFS transporter